MAGFFFARALVKWLEGMADSPAGARHVQDVEELPAAFRGEPEPVAAETEAEWVFPRVERAAMGSLFEIFLAGHDRETLIGAGEEALNQIERLDRQLSHYRDDSDVARLNANAFDHWVRLEPRMYHLLKRCAAVHAETGGAFDITIGSLVKAWGFFRGQGRIPPDDEIASLLPRTGMQRIEFDDSDDLVHFTVPGMEIDLGAVGKGYALDEAADLLRLYSVTAAVLHGGQSSIHALGSPPSGHSGTGGQGVSGAVCPPVPLPHCPTVGWRFDIKDPRDHNTVVETVYLRDEAISTSGSYEQFFEQDGVRYSHILDPRSGRPTRGMLSVSVIAPSAAESDALSTAFFVMGPAAAQEYCASRPHLKVIMMEDAAGPELRVTRIGFEGEP